MRNSREASEPFDVSGSRGAAPAHRGQGSVIRINMYEVIWLKLTGLYSSDDKTTRLKLHLD